MSLLLGHGMRPWYPRTSAGRGSGGIPDTACVESGDGFTQTTAGNSGATVGPVATNNEVQADSGITDLVVHHL